MPTVLPPVKAINIAIDEQGKVIIKDPDFSNAVKAILEMNTPDAVLSSAVAGAGCANGACL